MKIFYNLLAVLCISLPGMLVAQSTVSGSLISDGTNRSYRLRIPPAASSGDLLPLVINMHGFTGTASQQENSSGMNDVADTANFFVVYPNGTNTFLFLQGWNSDLSASGGADDVLFISDLIDELSALYPIDEDKVFATGFSQGGGMSVALACALSDRIRAIAPVGAAVAENNGPLCNPANKIPVCQFHGTSDAIVPYAGGFGQAPALEVISAFATMGGCTGAPNTVNLPNTSTSDGSTVSLAFADDCGPDNNSYRFYRINGGGHTWPGDVFANQDINASVEMWNFFRNTYADEAPRLASNTAAQTMLSPSLLSGAATVSVALSETENLTAAFYNISGSKVYETSMNGNLIDVPAFSTGIYSVVITQDGNFVTSAKLAAQ